MMNMSRPILSFPVAMLLALLASCGDDTAERPSTTDVCTSVCDWQAKCHQEDRAACIKKCTTESDLSKYRTEWMTYVNDCFKSLACGESDDHCVANFAAVDPAYPNLGFVQSCLQKRAACENSFADDYCASITALTDDRRAKAALCNALECGAVLACLKDAGSFNY